MEVLKGLFPKRATPAEEGGAERIFAFKAEAIHVLRPADLPGAHPDAEIVSGRPPPTPTFPNSKKSLSHLFLFNLFRTSGKASDTQESPKSEGSDSEPPQSPLPERVAQIPEPPRTKRNKSGGSGLGDFESQIIGMVDSLKKKKDNEKDDDYLFVQSLLPYLKKVPEEKKIDLQIDILQLVKTYMQPGGSQPLLD